MCLIIIGKKKDIKAEWLPQAWSLNHDGSGIAIPGNKPYIIKGLMTLEALQKAFNKIPENLRIAVHFRMGTHGSINAKNTHPFRVDDYTYLMHNGVLHGLGSWGKNGYSDTAHLSRILGDLRKSYRKSLLNTLNGKFALIDQSITLYGNFERHANCYFSNNSIIPATPVSTLGFNKYNYYNMYKSNYDRVFQTEPITEPINNTDTEDEYLENYIARAKTTC